MVRSSHQPNRTLTSHSPIIFGLVIMVVLLALWWSEVAHSAPAGSLSISTPLSNKPSQAPICGTPTFVSGTIISDTIWSTTNLYVLNGDLTISAGVTLTIQPGVVIKAQVGTHLFVNGKIIANGTVPNPVYFTSWKDDTVCGDTNGDGSASVPAPKDWGWIEFGSSGDPNRLFGNCRGEL